MVVNVDFAMVVFVSLVDIHCLLVLYLCLSCFLLAIINLCERYTMPWFYDRTKWDHQANVILYSPLKISGKGVPRSHVT